MLLCHEDFDSPIGSIHDVAMISQAGIEYGTSWGEGSNGMKMRGVNDTFTINLPSAHTTVIYGGRMRHSEAAPNTSQSILRFSDSVGVVCELRYTGDLGNWNVIDAAGSSIGTSSGVTMSRDVWYTVEVKLTHGASGSIDIRINGIDVFSATGQDFTDGGSGITTVDFDATTGAGAAWTAQHWDWFYICDGTGSYNNDFLGDVKCEYILPDGDGTTTDWTPDTGATNYTQVDEATRNDADYVQAGTEGNIDLYTYAALTATPGDIIAVSPIPYCDLPDGGSRFLRPVTRVSATNYTPLSSWPVAVTSGIGRFFLEENPNTTAPWTASEVDAAEFGYEVRDS